MEVGIGEIDRDRDGDFGKMPTPPLRSIHDSSDGPVRGAAAVPEQTPDLSPTSRVSLAPRPSSRLLHLKNRPSPGLIGAEPPLPHPRSS